MAKTGLSESLENYLEAIFMIIQEREAVRSKDIAARLGVSTASVTGALRALSQRSLVNYEPYGVITLTARGRRIASEVARTHHALRDFLVKVLSVPPDVADEAACRMEHAIPSEVMKRLMRFSDFMEECPYVGAGWDEAEGYFCQRTRHNAECSRCRKTAVQRGR